MNVLLESRVQRSGARPWRGWWVIDSFRPPTRTHVNGDGGSRRVRRSLAALGTSADNALAESFNAALKRETLAGAATYGNEASCRREVFRWAVRYNTRRHHSYLGQVSPNAYESKLAATIPEAA